MIKRRNTMLNKLFITFVTAILLVAGFLYASKFQDAAKVNAQNDQIEVLLKQMKASDWESRETAFYKLLDLIFGGEFNGQTGQIPAELSKFSGKHPKNADEINTTLIWLLETENDFMRAHAKKYEITGEALTEEYTNYHGDLIGTVAGLKDSRAVNALIGAINTGSMATNGLAEIAPFSIDAVVERADSNDLLTRDVATIVLSKMLEPTKISRLETQLPGSREKIKQLLLRKVKDTNQYIRQSAIDGLAKLPDADVIKVLEDISKNDLYQTDPANGKMKSYPVRDAAKKQLNRIKQN